MVTMVDDIYQLKNACKETNGEKNYSLGNLFLNELDSMTYRASVKGHYKLELPGSPVFVADVWLKIIKMWGWPLVGGLRKVRSSGITCS